MIVNRVEIRIDKTGDDTSINIPLSLEFTPTDNSELIQDKFVNDEVNNAINQITDYKKVRFKPAKVVNGVWEVIDEFKIENVFLPSGTTPNYETIVGESVSPYSTLGFIDDDLFCRYNKLMRSFLSLDFYDSPDVNVNSLLSFTYVYTQIFEDQKYITGLALPAVDSPVSYRIGDPLLKPRSVHEGFHLYWYKDLVDNAPNMEYSMYMTATFNNAKNGHSPAMQSKPTPSDEFFNVNLTDVSGENGSRFLKVILKYDTTDKTYKYTFAPNANQPGVDWNVTSGIPTITLYQIAVNIF